MLQENQPTILYPQAKMIRECSVELESDFDLSTIASEVSSTNQMSIFTKLSKNSNKKCLIQNLMKDNFPVPKKKVSASQTSNYNSNHSTGCDSPIISHDNFYTPQYQKSKFFQNDMQDVESKEDTFSDLNGKHLQQSFEEFMDIEDFEASSSSKRNINKFSHLTNLDSNVIRSEKNVYTPKINANSSKEMISNEIITTGKHKDILFSSKQILKTNMTSQRMGFNQITSFSKIENSMANNFTENCKKGVESFKN